MPLDPNAISQGIATGASIPNKNTGLSDLIRTITKDLQQQKIRQETSNMKNMEMRMGLLGQLLPAGYKIDANKFLQTGDLSTAQAPSSAFDVLRGNMEGMKLKGMTINERGQPQLSYESGNIPTAEAGKASLAEQSVRDIEDVKKLLYPTGQAGSFNRKLALASNVPGGNLPIIPSRLWGRNEQDIYRKMGGALSTRQLIQTGVAARPEETARLVSQFTPGAGTNPQAGLSGLNELQDFYRNYLGTITTGKVGQATKNTILQTGTDQATGRKVAKMSNGSIIYIDTGEPYNGD